MDVVFATSFSLKAEFSEASVSKAPVSQKLLHLSKANSQSIVLSDMMYEMTLNDSVESLATAGQKMGQHGKLFEQCEFFDMLTI